MVVFLTLHASLFIESLIYRDVSYSFLYFVSLGVEELQTHLDTDVDDERTAYDSRSRLGFHRPRTRPSDLS